MFHIYGIAKAVKYFPIRLLYRLRGYRIGRHFTVGRQVNIEKKGFLSGDHVYIGPYSYIGPNTEIGNFCMLADNVNIVGSDHDFSQVGVPIILAGRPSQEPKTIIEDDVWVGHGVTIIRGVKIGEGSILAANSVITRDVEPYSICGGIPARVIKQRFAEDEAKIHSKFLSEYRNR